MSMTSMPVAQDNPRGTTVLALSTVFVALSFLCVVARLLTRIYIVSNAGRDDICIAVSWLFSLGLTVTLIFQVENGLGLHQDTLTDGQVTRMLRAFWASLWLYYLALCFNKIALILQYLRIFTQKWFRIAAWSLLAVVVAYSVWTVFSSIFACLPVESFWNLSIHGSCLPHSVSWYVNAAVNIATEIATIILPMPLIRELQLPQKQRIALIAVFALGGFVCVVSMIRIKTLRDISGSNDVSYSNPNPAVWSAIEVNVGIICASLPTLKAALARFFPRLFARSYGSQDQLSRSNHAAAGVWAQSQRNNFGAMARSRLSIDCSPGVPAHYLSPQYGHKSQVRSHASGNRSHSSGSSDDTEMLVLPRDAQGMGESNRKINVVTVVEQEVEQKGSGESSTRATRYGSPERASDADSEFDMFPPSRRQDLGRHQEDFERYAGGRG